MGNSEALLYGLLLWSPSISSLRLGYPCNLVKRLQSHQYSSNRRSWDQAKPLKVCNLTLQGSESLLARGVLSKTTTEAQLPLKYQKLNGLLSSVELTFNWLQLCYNTFILKMSLFRMSCLSTDSIWFVHLSYGPVASVHLTVEAQHPFSTVGLWRTQIFNCMKPDSRWMNDLVPPLEAQLLWRWMEQWAGLGWPGHRASCVLIQGSVERQIYSYFEICPVILALGAQSHHGLWIIDFASEVERKARKHFLEFTWRNCLTIAWILIHKFNIFNIGSLDGLIIHTIGHRTSSLLCLKDYQ